MDARQFSQNRVRNQPGSRFANLVGCGLLAISCVIASNTNRARSFADQPTDPFAEDPVDFVSNKTTKLASELDTQVGFAGLRLEQPPGVASPNDIVPAPVPETVLPSRSPSDPRFRGSRPTTPAQRMTIRVNPLDRELNDPQTTGVPGSGKSIRAVQQDIEKHEQDNTFTNQPIMRYSDLGWSNDLPYGKYIYIHHGPLLFEDIPLERYGEGHCDCFQAYISFAKFVTTVPIVPYKLAADYCAAYRYDAWYAFDKYGNIRPGVTEGSYLPSLRPMKNYR